VDGSPKAGDAYVGNTWKTILVGTLGGGGKAVFALDVTDPDNMTASDVLWEITDTTPGTIDANGDSMLGYTMGQASIVRMANGHWAVVFGNGYNSASNRAVLFIKDLEDGTLMAFDTEVGDSTTPNGLSSPTAVDENGDAIVDAIYAGDLRGNVWKIDVSNSNTNQWDFAYQSGNSPEPVFTAVDASSNPQPITAKIEVGAHPSGGVMLYFGTGKYIETSDVTSNSVQTLYGIRDDGDTVSGRSVLQQQQILLQTTETYTAPDGSTETYNVRVTSQNPVDYTPTADGGLGQKGWYMDLKTPIRDVNDGSLTGYSEDGERVIANPVLREGKILFTTMIPDSNPCNFGGTSWSADLTAIDGSRPPVSPYDLNNDGSFDTSDYVQVPWDVNGDGNIDENDKIVSSGKESKVGITKTPAIIRVADREYRYAGGSEGGIERTTGARTAVTGRQSWKQIQ
jgi:type IV pilus assembly protein PilY1